MACFSVKVDNAEYQKLFMFLNEPHRHLPPVIGMYSVVNGLDSSRVISWRFNGSLSSDYCGDDSKLPSSYWFQTHSGILRAPLELSVMPALPS